MQVVERPLWSSKITALTGSSWHEAARREPIAGLWRFLPCSCPEQPSSGATDALSGRFLLSNSCYRAAAPGPLRQRSALLQTGRSRGPIERPQCAQFC